MWLTVSIVLFILLALTLLYMKRLIGIARENRRDADRAEEAISAILRELNTGDPSLSEIQSLAYAAVTIDLDDLPEGF